MTPERPAPGEAEETAAAEALEATVARAAVGSAGRAALEARVARVGVCFRRTAAMGIARRSRLATMGTRTTATAVPPTA